MRTMFPHSLKCSFRSDTFVLKWTFFTKTERSSGSSAGTVGLDSPGEFSLVERAELVGVYGITNELNI
jgi:hypothetical protein